MPIEVLTDLHSFPVIAAVVGFVQGFVAYATTVGLAGKLGTLILVKAQKIYDPLRAAMPPTVSDQIAKAISFLALVLLHIVVLEVVLGALSERNAALRAHLGRIWLFALIAGLVVSRLLPEIETRLRARKSKQ